ncbi:MAG TPA: GNAT family N-acetyltransferase [Gammaproteobacteria bacterium]|nr:GNAT family N-acetyltransferase [Gammaproteobacteria bacterium]
MSIRIRNADADDFDYLMVLNESSVPEVNGLDGPALEKLVAMAPYCRVVEQDGEDAGFLLGLEAGADYASVNYQFFSARYDSFAYVDRVVIDAANRGQGLGTALYDDFEAWARERGAPRIACEVNLRPPNEASRAFHLARGFKEIGSQETEAGSKTVTLMIKDLG